MTYEHIAEMAMAMMAFGLPWLSVRFIRTSRLFKLNVLFVFTISGVVVLLTPGGPVTYFSLSAVTSMTMVSYRLRRGDILPVVISLPQTAIAALIFFKIF
jgi:hypothetical protein